MTRDRRENGGWTAALHIFVLFGFAFAQPIFDMLSRPDGFDLFLNATPASVFFPILVVCFVLPALVVGAERIAAFWSSGLRGAVHLAAVGGLVALIALPPAKQAIGGTGWTSVSVALVAGALVAWSYARLASVRLFLTVLAPSVVIFPALFLTSSTISKLVFLKGDNVAPAAGVSATAPVVLIVLDELPVTSLMDEQRRIDPALYPNLASLAADATWYRNTTTVADYTMHAVPALLSGRRPSVSSLPTTADYPHSLFTLLGAAYDLHVYESYTHVCPRSLCRAAAGRGKEQQRISALLLPIARLYLRIVLPEDVKADAKESLKVVRRLASPAIGPGRLAQRGPATRDKVRLGTFDAFLGSIEPGERPAVYFVHLQLPHFPWEFLPSGSRYPPSGIPGLSWDSLAWGPDEQAPLRAYQRHLLQVGFVDRLLGRVLQRLKETDLYDRSLIAVVADHGVSFRANDHMRDLTATNAEDILPVPLLIKAPHQEEPAVSDRHLETIDLLPTLADLLGVRLPWPVDGRSALEAPTAAPAGSARVMVRKAGGTRQVAYTSERVDAALRRKLRLFGSGEGLAKLFEIGPHVDWIGRRERDAAFARDSDVGVEIQAGRRSKQATRSATLIPALITGSVRSASSGVDTLDVGIALNGTIQATARAITRDSGKGEFSVMIPEAAFRAGKNVLSAFVWKREETGSMAPGRASRPGSNPTRIAGRS
jgi:hypothetical protein